MKKQYEEPEVRVILMETEEVICNSNIGGDEWED